MNEYKRACAYVDLDAILENYKNMKQNLAKDTKIIGVIKTDGYGHGAVQIARELEELDYVWGYATATAEEAFILKECGMKKPILILGYSFPDAYEEILKWDIRPTLFREDQIEEFDKAACRAGRKLKIHIKVDTAMSRLGIWPNDSGIEFIKEVLAKDNLEIEGIFTHFAKADMNPLDDARKQVEVFTEFMARIEEECQYKDFMRHCANSAGLIRISEADMSAVRAGIIQYGLWPSDEVEKDIVSLQPALSLKSHIVYSKEIQPGMQVSYGGTYQADTTRRIATIPVGYGDGYPRSLSNKGYVLVHGKKAPIIGRVCMDQFMIDVTEIEDAQMGDEVTLIGKDGESIITAEEVGQISGRFNYELVCDLGKRIPRVYQKQGKVISKKDYFRDYS